MCQTHQTIAHPWIINTRFGFVYESPSSLKESKMQMNDYDEYLIQNHYYSYAKGNFIIINMIMDLKINEFDPQTGLYGAINNMVSKFGGNNLNLSYSTLFPRGINKECTGFFYRQNEKFLVRGFSYFNTRKRVFTLISIGPANNETKNNLNRIFNSIKITEK